MKINQYECPKCGYRVDVGIYSRLISGQRTCFNEHCDANPREYNLIQPGQESVFIKNMWKKHPEGFKLKIGEAIVEYKK